MIERGSVIISLERYEQLLKSQAKVNIISSNVDSLTFNTMEAPISPHASPGKLPVYLCTSSSQDMSAALVNIKRLISS